MHHGSPKHASWTGTLLYIDSTKVVDAKKLQPDLESQHQKEKENFLTKVTHDGQRYVRVDFTFSVTYLHISIGNGAP